jgi:hypothetical protein
MRNFGSPVENTKAAGVRGVGELFLPRHRHYSTDETVHLKSHENFNGIYACSSCMFLLFNRNIFSRNMMANFSFVS